MNKKRKIIFGLLIAVVLVFVIGSLVLNLYENRLEKIVAQEVGTINLNEIEDGEYIGKAGTFPVKATVEVTVENHKIISIEIIEHQNGQGESAEAIVGRVLAEQDLDVDIISQATYSSKVILLAIEDALKPVVSP